MDDRRILNGFIVHKIIMDKKPDTCTICPFMWTDISVEPIRWGCPFFQSDFNAEDRSEFDPDDGVLKNCPCRAADDEYDDEKSLSGLLTEDE